MVDIPYDRRTKTDPYVLYKQSDFKAYLRHEKVPSFRFYGEDHVDYSETNQTQDISSTRVQSLTISFWLYSSENIKPEQDDYIKSLKDGTIWRIDNLIVSDDGIMKEHSMRPRTYYIAALTRAVGDDR